MAMSAPNPVGPAVFVGDAVRVVRHSETVGSGPSPPRRTEIQAPAAAADASLQVPGCQLVRLPTFRDPRGQITVAELDDALPFAIHRIFFVYAVPGEHVVRGDHAHRSCTQLLLPFCGAVSVVIDDGIVREEIRLNDPGIGLLIPPGIWSMQHRVAPGTVLAVFCSERYDPREYIRDYHEFLETVSRSRRER